MRHSWKMSASATYKYNKEKQARPAWCLRRLRWQICVGTAVHLRLISHVGCEFAAGRSAGRAFHGAMKATRCGLYNYSCTCARSGGPGAVKYHCRATAIMLSNPVRGGSTGTLNTMVQAPMGGGCLPSKSTHGDRGCSMHIKFNLGSRSTRVLWTCAWCCDPTRWQD